MPTSSGSLLPVTHSPHCARSFLQYEAIFTTSYDLLLYWSMGSSTQGFDGFCDYFWSNGCNEFDPRSVNVHPGYVPVHFVHGAMHLIVGGNGATRKLTRLGGSLLDQFGEPVDGDSDARPLLVTEGSSHDKLRAIDGNDYLTHCLNQLKAHDGPLVVFGHGFGEQDMHLVDAINRHPDRPVAVSIRPKEHHVDVRPRQANVRRLLDAEELYFFDAETYQLGDPNMRVRVATAD